MIINLPTGSRSVKLLFMAALTGIVMLACAVYSNSLRNGFTYDDYLVVAANPRLAHPVDARKYLSEEYFSFSWEGSYRPVITLVYRLTVRTLGCSPAALHLMALLLHAANAILAVLIARRLGLGLWAFWCGAAFAVHPALTEAVCGIGFMEDVLSTFFVAAAACIILGAGDDCPSAGKFYLRGGLAAALLLLACLTKETGLALAILAPLFLLSSTGNDCRRRALLFSSIMLPAVIIFLVVRFAVLPGPMTGIARPGGTVISSLANSSVIFARYTGRMFLPADLSIDRTIAHTVDWASAGTPASALLHIALLAASALMLLKFRFRALGLGIVWFYIALTPVAGIIPIGIPEADRYLYLLSDFFSPSPPSRMN
jgi:hypothetical protein